MALEDSTDDVLEIMDKSNCKLVEEEIDNNMPGDTKQWLSKLLEAPIMQADIALSIMRYALCIMYFALCRQIFQRFSKQIILTAAHHLDPRSSLLQETDPRWFGRQRE